MKEMKQHSIKYNFLMNFILSASQMLFPLITFPYVSRVLLAEGSGKVSFALSVSNYFLNVASLGIPTYGIRACAQVKDDREKLSKTVQELLMINLITTVLVTITYLICIVTIPKFKTDETLFLINGINIVLNMFGMNWLFQALEQYDYITYRSLLFKIISVVCMFILVHEKSDYIIYAGITVFSATGSNLLNLFRARQYIDFKKSEDYNLKKHLKPVFILFAQNLAASIYTNLDTVMLGFMKTDVDVGYYNAAIKIKHVLWSLVSSLGNVLLPRMSYYAKEQMKDKFIDTMKMALNFTMLISFPLAIYSSVYSKEFIYFLAGTGYDGAIMAMKIITIAVIPSGLTTLLGVQVLTAIEREKYVLYSVVTGAVIDLVLNIFLIPKFGAAGAALATTIAEFTVLGVQIIYTKDLLYKIVKKLHGVTYLILTIVATTLSCLSKLVKCESVFITLSVSACIFFGTYAIGLIFIKDEFVMNQIDAIVAKRKK